MVLALAFLVPGVAGAQETFAGGDGDVFDASPCRDPGLAQAAARRNATPFRDTGGRSSPLAAALGYLARKYRDPEIDRAGVCMRAPGVVYLVPANRVAELRGMLRQMQAGTTQRITPQGSGASQYGVTVGRPPPPGPRLAPTAQTDPCATDYDMNTAAGRAEYFRTEPERRRACDARRCQHNPQLEVCRTLAGGAKTLQRRTDPTLARPEPDPLPDAEPFEASDSEILKTLTACLSDKADFYRPPPLRGMAGPVPARYRSGVLTYDSARLARFGLEDRVLELAEQVALHAQTLHDAKLGPSNRPSTDPATDIHAIVGFLYRCGVNANLVPTWSGNAADTDPRVIYMRHLGARALRDPRVERFSEGFTDAELLPASLLPPWTTGR
jgi:hypothetical protein